MMKHMLVVSDSHRKDDILLQLIDSLSPLDYLIHLGDAEGTEDVFQSAAGAGCRCYFVQGNNDFFTELPRYIETEIEGKKCFLAHGHTYGVGMDASGLADEARSRDCEIAMFGHTHKPYDRVIGGVRCLCPGSISYPRQANRKPSYILIDVDEQGEFHVALRFVDKW